MAMNQSFPSVEYLIQSVQRQVEALIERKEAINMQIRLDLGHISLFKNNVAE